MNIEQLRAVQQLEDIASVPGGALKILNIQAWDGNPSWVRADIEVNCAQYERSEEGIPLRDREHLIVLIPPGFPFAYPYVQASHDRWASYPHVMRDQTLCLYQAPAAEWDPSDQMYGFIARLHEWLTAAAKAELDPLGAPLHPPLAHQLSDSDAPIIVTTANTPVVTSNPWLGFAVLNKRSDFRLDLTKWIPLSSDDAIASVGTVILLAEPLPLIFPRRVQELIVELSRRGINRTSILLMLKLAALFNEEGAPLYMILGAPMRGIKGNPRLHQHLEVWRVPAVVADALRTVIRTSNATGEIKRLSNELETAILNWAEAANVDWCKVQEARPEIVVRRDLDCATDKLRGQAVALWGCGALGGPIAEALVRTGVRKILLHDRDIVKPGILVRQLFDDADIGKSKAHALAERLRRIRPDVEIVPNAKNLLNHLDQQDWAGSVDLIIDTTGSEAIVSKLELRRMRKPSGRVPIASLAVGHKGQNGVVAFSGSQYSGGPADVLRRAKLLSLSREDLRTYADEFWPEARRQVFQPEPGCSEPTFLGSAADLGALANTMLNSVAMALKSTSSSALASFISIRSSNAGLHDQPTTVTWSPDYILNDPYAGYEVRISESAWLEMFAWIRRSRRISGPSIETGGYLFGERDDSIRVVWITDVSGPPPDSEATAAHFLCGIEGIKQLATERRIRTRGAVRLLGQWHAHPTDLPVPSPTDLKGMTQVLTESTASSARSLMLIVGNTMTETPTVSAYDLSKAELDQLVHAGLSRTAEIRTTPRVRRSGARVDLALSGGGMRAIAFHLGCLRALHDRGVLEQVEVISCVSGGSVLGAMYAYSNEPFEEFDQRVVTLLRRGLVRSMVKAACRPQWALRAIGTTLLSGIVAVVTDIVRIAFSAGARILNLRGNNFPHWIRKIQPPLQRGTSRTDLLETALREDVFGTRTMTCERRNNLSIVINACELRTGSAFRFGSKESGCWRYGQLAGNENVTIAEAVAASAAYPILLPALDRQYRFINKDGGLVEQRVLLTDGGIFDNLGTSCLEPGRDPSFSTNVFNPQYLIACNAGLGLFDDNVVPYWWPTRMVRDLPPIPWTPS